MSIDVSWPYRSLGLAQTHIWLGSRHDLLHLAQTLTLPWGGAALLAGSGTCEYRFRCLYLPGGFLSMWMLWQQRQGSCRRWCSPRIPLASSWLMRLAVVTEYNNMSVSLNSKDSWHVQHPLPLKKKSCCFVCLDTDHH